jgi:lipopolysaccharide transport system permease protein
MVYRFLPDWRVTALPAFIAFGFFASIGPSLWITALNVKYRDFRYVIPFIVQFGLYIPPVGFSSSVIPQPWRLVYSLNPMVGVIDGFHLGRAERPLPARLGGERRCHRVFCLVRHPWL